VLRSKRPRVQDDKKGSDARDEECDNENEYDRHEDNEAFNESLSSLVRETTRNCSAVFVLTWSKFPDLENGVKPEPGCELRLRYVPKNEGPFNQIMPRV
jgi:hypothetical protein